MARATFILDVVTRSLANPEEVSRRQVDQYSHEGRAWLAKHCWWAMHEGYSVTTSPADRPLGEG